MSRTTLRRARSAVLGVLIPLLTHTVGRLPYGGLRAVARGLAWLLFKTNRRYRERSASHLEMAFPEATEAERRAWQKGCFLNASLNAVESLQLMARGAGPLDKRLTIEGWENVENESGNRILLLCCHSGFWEALGVAMMRQGMPLFAIGRRPDDPVFGAVVGRVREAVGAETIERATSGGRRLLRRALKGDGALAILIDQDTKVDGDWVPFFGRPAHTPLGAAELALRQGMRVVPAFLERRDGGEHAARFLPALELPEDAVGATAVMTEAIEAHIRRNPEQWVWWHRRWQRQPE